MSRNYKKLTKLLTVDDKTRNCYIISSRYLRNNGRYMVTVLLNQFIKRSHSIHRETGFANNTLIKQLTKTRITWIILRRTWPSASIYDIVICVSSSSYFWEEAFKVYPLALVHKHDIIRNDILRRNDILCLTRYV